MATKLMTITIEVEPPALGPVLLKLKEMPGIAKINFDVSDSKAASPDPVGPRTSPTEIITALLIRGPVTIDEAQAAFIRAGLKGNRGQVHTNFYALKAKGIVKTAEKGVYEFTAKAAKSIKGHEDTAIRLLPKPKTNGTHPPAKEKRKPPGFGQKVLLEMLSSGPAKKTKIAEQLGVNGMSAKSVEGVTFRAKEAGLVKSDGNGLFELTTKGKTEVEQVNG